MQKFSYLDKETYSVRNIVPVQYLRGFFTLYGNYYKSGSVIVSENLVSMLSKELYYVGTSAACASRYDYS